MQGIGFRPTAQRLAIQLGIKGEVKNTGGNVAIIAQGKKEALDEFIRRLVTIFKIVDFKENITEDRNFTDFTIIHSTNDNNIPFITADIATCDECEKELKDKNNKRYNHPFISCINCGPRYTIINNLPYDRDNTTMGKFRLCSSCEEEYTTPADKRCHAQTIACNNCGPTTSITIDNAVKELENDNILAIKDIGGYHFACKCTNDLAIKMRKLKGREAKPFAIMFSTIDEIKQYCKVNIKEEELLKSSARPIVLLEKIKSFPYEICKDSDYIGAFLPCNPIQIMILEKVSPLIMTSANISDQPIIIDDEQIKKFNVPILSHDRKILTPIDDSVVQVNCGKTQFIRRARGYVPLAIDIGVNAKKDTLCLGGDLKSTFCFVHSHYAYLSQNFGDLENTENLTAYKDNIKRFAKLHSFNTEKIVADKHPMYNSAHIYNNDTTIFHHLAHAYSVVAEHHIKGNALHFVFDGTGFGGENNILGGEVFFNTKRVEHLEYTKIPASDEIAKNADLALACYKKSNALINSAIENNINIVNYSGMGRLFDAVCALLDIKHYNSFEGECAIALENAARKSNNPYYIKPSWCPTNIIEQIENSNADVNDIALGFHQMLGELILQTAKKYNTKQITLSGGCFINKILTSYTINTLENAGYKVYINEKVPCGDGGIALGQAYLSALEE